jgi:hypothetical protein
MAYGSVVAERIRATIAREGGVQERELTLM